MPSASGKKRPSRSASPLLSPRKRPSRSPLSPPPPRLPVKSQGVDTRKSDERKGKGTYTDIPPETSLRAKLRSISVQDYQQLGTNEIKKLRSEAQDLLLSDDSSRHLSLVGDFANSSVPCEERPTQVKALWNFCARIYPNSLSFVLVRLLYLYNLPSGTRADIVDLLHLTINRFHGRDRIIFNEDILDRIKPLLLDVIQNLESRPDYLPNLSEVAARICELQRWEELLDYVFAALHTSFEAKQEMALRVLSRLPETRQECLGAFEFWRAKRQSLQLRFLELFGSANINIRALTFDASVKLVRRLHFWKHDDELDGILQRMIRFLRAFHRDAQTHIVEPRMKELVELAKGYTDHFLKNLDLVLGCMFQIAETTEDDNTFIKCQAIEIIKILDERDSFKVSQYYPELSKESKRSILKNCVRLMFRIADVPACYNLDTVHTGISGNHKLGMFLLHRLCLYSHEHILLSFGIEMIPQYLNSEDWQTRHAGVTAFAAIGSACSPEMIREQAERVIDISLIDSHQRVRWAAIGAILSLVKNSPKKERVKYLTKFVPRLININISASNYRHIQLDATVAIRLLIGDCGDEEVKSFLKDLLPVLLCFLEEDKTFREEAMETLKSLAVSFPAIVRGYYQEAVDSLKAFTSQSLPDKRFVDDLGFIFLGPLLDQSLSLLNDVQEEALSQLCKQPQLVVDQFLDNIKPDLLMTLENANPYSMELILKKKNSTRTKKVVLTCDLLTKLAAQFPKQFEPWASEVCPLLISLFACTDPDAKIASVRVLPSLLRSCEHTKKNRKFLFNLAVRELFNELQKEIMHKSMGIEMLKSLNACIRICGTQVLRAELVKQIADLIYLVLFQASFDKVEIEKGEEASSRPDDKSNKLELEEHTIQAANCLMTMINSLKSEFLPHFDKLLPAVQGLWVRNCPDNVKAVAISIFNLVLNDYPHKLQGYGDRYPNVVMGLCYSQNPQLQQEAAHGVGLCASHTELMPDMDVPVCMDGLEFVIDSGRQSEERAMAYDAAVSAFGKMLEFRRHNIIDRPDRMPPLWPHFLPSRHESEEAKLAHAQLSQLLDSRSDRDLLGHNDENLSRAIQICQKILSQSDNLATDARTSMIESWLTKVEAKP